MAYPQTVTTFTSRTDGSVIYAAHINDIQSEITAIETEEARTYRPDMKPASPSAYDDEFESATLAAGWTAANCATGTIDLFEDDPAAGVYDLSTFAGMLALQPVRDDDGGDGLEAGAAMVRKTITLGTNCKVVAKVGVMSTGDSTGATVAGIMLGTSDGFDGDDYIYIAVSSDDGGGDIVGQTSIGNTVTDLNTGGPVSGEVYLAIFKTGTAYRVAFGTGANWALLNDGGATPDAVAFTISATLNRLTLFGYWPVDSGETNYTAPICTFDFVRYFANNTPTVNA